MPQPFNVGISPGMAQSSNPADPSTYISANSNSTASSGSSGSGPPVAGSGVANQPYYDTSAHAMWLNVAGTWVQLGFLAAPTAAPIPPPATASGNGVGVWDTSQFDNAVWGT